jgi:hypothetical protein
MRKYYFKFILYKFKINIVYIQILDYGQCEDHCEDIFRVKEQIKNFGALLCEFEK